MSRWSVLSPKSVRAIAIIENHGCVTFKTVNGGTEIRLHIYGFKEGKHGFHIHERGSIEKGCSSLCAHYNPYGAKHGGQGDDKDNRHVGDLGNIVINKDGECNTKFVDNLVQLDGQYSVIGRSIIIHEDEDDLGRGENEESLKTGNAGKRIACARIEISG
jgi:superoxide dismutase, Cu-Zn family